MDFILLINIKMPTIVGILIFILLINIKMPTIVGILIFISRKDAPYASLETRKMFYLIFSILEGVPQEGLPTTLLISKLMILRNA